MKMLFTICTAIGLASAFESSDPKKILADGRAVTCSTDACTVTSKVDANFHWTPELRAKAKPMVPRKTPISADATSNETRAQDCPVPEHVTDLSALPGSLVGRIHFQTAEGNTLQCSGAFVDDHSMVLTAGHCCFDHQNNQFYKNFEVVLGYDNGGGTAYSASTVAVSPMWKCKFCDANTEVDFCFIKMKDEGPGFLGWEADIDFSQAEWKDNVIDAYGYAHNFGAGEELYVAHSTYAAKSFALQSLDAGTYKANCNPMHKGNSGGPWLSNHRVIGLNSHHDGGDETTSEWSPYFGKGWVETCQSLGFCKTYQEAHGSFVKNSSFSRSEAVVV